MGLMRRGVLVLNSVYEPIRIVAARRALTMICKGTAQVELPTSIQVHVGIFLPSVIRLIRHRHVTYRLPITSRKNILTRDGYRCMYCGIRLHPSQLTLDHVIPRSRGGRNDWANLVACCASDNRRKADRTPEEAGMKLLRRPLPASVHSSRFLLRSLGSETDEWGKYLWNDNAGDRRYAFN